MLPKPEKIKKSSSSKSEQLDLVETISTEDKLKTKRRWLYIALFSTIGLSLLFMVYRSVKTFFVHPQITLPHLSIPSTPSSHSNLDQKVSTIIGSDSNHYSITVHLLNGSTPTFNWSKSTSPLDETQISSLIENLQTNKEKNKSIIAKYLPQGSQVQENYTSAANSIILQSLVTIPNQKILFVITATGNDLSKFSNVLSKLIPTLYWSVIQSSP